MNTELQTVQFDGIPLSIIDHNGEGWFAGDDIGKALDYNHPKDSVQNIFDRNRDELEEYSVTIKLMATDGKQYDTRVFNEEGVMIIGFLSKQPKAVAFRKWAVKVLKAYRHNELPQQTHDVAYLDEVKSHLDTQKQLSRSMQVELDYLKKEHQKQVSVLVEHIKKQDQTIAYLRHGRDEHQATLDRAVRAQRPITAAEEQEIRERKNWAVRTLSLWFYRSPAIIKRTLKGGAL